MRVTLAFVTLADLVALLVAVVPAAKRDEVRAIPELAATLERQLADVPL